MRRMIQYKVIYKDSGYFISLFLDFHQQNLHGEKDASEKYKDEDDESFPLLHETDFGCSSGSKSITRQNR